MGEIAEMMLDGCLCAGCGVYLGRDNGYPEYCADCEKDGYAAMVDNNVPATKRERFMGKKKRTTPCPQCNRKFSGSDTLNQHIAAMRRNGTHT